MFSNNRNPHCRFLTVLIRQSLRRAYKRRLSVMCEREGGGEKKDEATSRESLKMVDRNQ